MSPRPRPEMSSGWPRRGKDDQGRPVCSYGHTIAGGNVKSNGSCKACAAALTWARRRNLFVDDPRVNKFREDTYSKMSID